MRGEKACRSQPSRSDARSAVANSVCRSCSGAKRVEFKDVIILYGLRRAIGDKDRNAPALRRYDAYSCPCGQESMLFFG